MSDAIVVWRAWVLYHDNLKVRILLCLCMLGSLGGCQRSTYDNTLLTLPASRCDNRYDVWGAVAFRKPQIHADRPPGAHRGPPPSRH
jgi:hypothetical protein